MVKAPIRFGIPHFIEKMMSVHPLGNGNMYIRYYTLVWVDVGELVSQTHEYVTWCYRTNNGEKTGPFWTFDVSFNGQGEIDPQCPDGQVVDHGTSGEESVSSDGVPVEYESDKAEPIDMKLDDDELDQLMEEDFELKEIDAKDDPD